jgi:hypothetical protein
MPPTLKRKNSLSSARAIDLPTLVLPVPGGPTNRMILPETPAKQTELHKQNTACVVSTFAQISNGDKLQNPISDSKTTVNQNKKNSYLFVVYFSSFSP